MKKVLSTISLIVSLLLMMSVRGAYASTSSLLTLTNTRKGMHIHVYQIAEVRGDQYTYTEAFADATNTSVDLNHLKTSEKLSAAADTLKGYAAKVSGIDVIASANQTNISHLKNGIYLILIDNYQDGYTTYSYLPYIIQISNVTQVELSKYTTTTTSNKVYQYDLTKYWSGGSSYPETVKVDLYNGSTFEKTLTLKKSSNYSLSWTSTTQKNYAIVEHAIKGYTSSVKITNNGDTTHISLINTANSEMTTYHAQAATPQANSTSQTMSGSQKNPSRTMTSSSTPSYESNKTSTHTKKTNTRPTASHHAVKTGDTTNVTKYIALFGFAGLMLIIIGKYLKN